MNRVTNRSSSGFTLVELLLAMSFISVLLIVIAVTVIQISNIYNRGLTMKAVDQAGRLISTDIRQTLSQSQPFDTMTAFRKQPLATGADGGRLCTGAYTYVWNTGKSLADISGPINRYDGGSTAQIRFVRVRDSGGTYCGTPLIPINPANATELLSEGDRNLAIQSFDIKQVPLSLSTSQSLYRIEMEIGTNDQSALIVTTDTRCKPPSDADSLQDYCAVNIFDFTALTGNEGGQ